MSKGDGPFTVLALLCGLVAAPQSIVSRVLASPPFAALADLSFAIYLLHCAVCHVYTFVLGKMWYSEIERMQPSADAPLLNALDYFAVCALTTAVAYPVTRFVEPRVAAWLELQQLRSEKMQFQMLQLQNLTDVWRRPAQAVLLAQYSAAYASATEDLAKSEAEIGVEVYQAMSYAIAEP